MIKILHISDFHYSEKYHADFNMRAEQLCNEIKKHHIDLAVFSGDLVFNGGEMKDFAGARKALLDNIETATGLSKAKIIIALGNHDVDRDQVPEMLQGEYKKMDSPKSLDKWLTTKSNEKISLQSTTNYNDFIVDYYKNCEVLFTHYCNTRFIDIDGVCVGIASLNSAWASYDSKTDRGQLMLPIYEVANAIDAVRKADVVVATMHHRLDDYKEPFMWDICERLYPYVHLLCTGHHHWALESDHRFGGNCMAQSEGCAIYNQYDSSSQYGFKIITIETDLNKKPISVKDDEYHFVNGRFLLNEGVVRSMANSAERQTEIEFQKNLLRLYHVAECRADDVFVADKIDASEGVTFKKLFTPPVIKDISPLQEFDDKKIGKIYSIEDLFEDNANLLVHGYQGKCGKTSLLWKLYLDSILKFDSIGFIPLYLNCKNFKNDGLQKANVLRTIREEFHLNKQDAKKLFSERKLLLLLDDVDLSNNVLLNSIGLELKEIANYRIIACLGGSLSATVVTTPIDGIAFKKLYFHSIGQKEVHQLTKKWPDLKSNRVDIEQKILSVFKQMHIPFNYWTISLFLWIFDKTDGDKIRNNFELVSLYVDGLLNKSSIIQDHSLKIEYRDLCKYLSCMARKMLEYEEDGYWIPYKDFVDFTEDFVDKNKRFPRNYNDVVNTLLSSRVIVKDGEEKMSIRLKGVFEYFLAYSMTNDEKWRNEIIDNDEKYLAFANELELFAGFECDNFDFVKKIYERSQSILKPLIENPDYSNIDEAFQEKVKQLSADIEKIKDAAGQLISKTLSLTDLEKDEILPVAIAQKIPIDSSEVQKKEYSNCFDTNVDNFEKSLFLLSRVYRNSNICNEEVGDKILDYILDACCKFSFAIVNTQYDKEDSEDELRKLVLTLYRFIPIVIQAYFFDAISQFNLDRVFDDKLSSIKKNEVNGKYFKIFLLLFTLLDLDIRSYSNLIDDIRNYSPKGAFRYAAFAKVCLLIMKNASGNQELLNKLVEIADCLNADMTPNRILNEERNSFRNQLATKISNQKLKDANQKRMIEADFSKSES